MSRAIDVAFERRAERARLLAGGAVAAREPLRFAAGLYRVQGRLAAALEGLHGRRALTGRLTEDVAGVVEASGELLRFAAENGPAGLAGVARARSGEAKSLCGSRLLAFWDADRPTEPDYLSRALLRPYVEILAKLGIAPDRPLRAGHCPFCGGAPWVAARRSAAEGDGASRFLACAVCGGEWSFARIRCPACSEHNPERLPCFRSDTYPAVRIEACETCRRYVKSIDLTLDARAIPEVDDLLSLSMDLWAESEGFDRIEPGLAGI
ncbi:MAG: formate dehydrogenase accessory protein FdhE [Gemmatimonadetes bacterium]|nr:formate dehydrogenase accessory protein FdhE [Gemmatimonadota bacterium]